MELKILVGMVEILSFGPEALLEKLEPMQLDMTLHPLPPAVPGGEVATCSGEAGSEGGPADWLHVC